MIEVRDDLPGCISVPDGLLSRCARRSRPPLAGVSGISIQGHAYVDMRSRRENG